MPRHCRIDPASKRLPVSLAAALMCLCAAPQQIACAAPQLKARGSILANVDPPAEVELRNSRGIPVARAKADNCSKAVFEDLPDGVYSATATRDGGKFPVNPSVMPDDEPVLGCVVVNCLITALGTVRECQVLEPVGPQAKALLKQLERRRYQPAVCDGKAVETTYTYRIYSRWLD